MKRFTFSAQPTLALITAACAIASIIMNVQAVSLNRQTTQLANETARQNRALTERCGQSSTQQEILYLLQRRIDRDDQALARITMAAMAVRDFTPRLHADLVRAALQAPSPLTHPNRKKQ